MGNNGMRFVLTVVFTCLCIDIDVAELCSDQDNIPAVNFCIASAAENRSIIYIGNDKSPRYENYQCTCTITAVTLQGQLAVNWKQTFDTANISFVLKDGNVIVMKTGTAIGIHIPGAVKVIYQTSELDEVIPFCLELSASIGTFSVNCARYERFIYTTSTSTSSPTITNSTEKAISKNKEDHTVILGPIIGGICALIIVIAVPAIVIVVIIRRKKRKQDTTRDPVPHIEGETAGNNTYDDLDHQNPTNNVNTEYGHIANRSGEVNASYVNTDI